MTGMKSQGLYGLGNLSDQTGRIAWAARDFANGNLAAHHSFHHRNDLPYRVPSPGPQVEGRAGRPGIEIAQSGQVSVRKISYVQVIANGRPVHGVIVGSINIEAGRSAHSC